MLKTVCGWVCVCGVGGGCDSLKVKGVHPSYAFGGLGVLEA